MFVSLAAMSIDAALYSGSKCYFFKGSQYVRVTRGETGPGTVDPGYPAPISNWGWPGGFGASGIDAALYSGSKCYFFKGDQYVRVTRGESGPGTVDPGYPAPISNWGWPGGFGGVSTAGATVIVTAGGPRADDVPALWAVYLSGPGDRARAHGHANFGGDGSATFAGLADGTYWVHADTKAKVDLAWGPHPSRVEVTCRSGHTEHVELVFS
jgi:hypothetical protein